MLQLGVPAEQQVQRRRARAIIESAVFQVTTLLLVICYVKSILIHPGEIPDRGQDASWEPAAQAGEAATVAGLQESKRSGERRYCKWCAKYKPDRCHHCRVCRTCILKMDHHCPWIYNCVGFRNHKYFFLLLLYSALDLWFVVITMFKSTQRATRADVPFALLFLLLFWETLASFLGILVTAFFAFHVWLMLKA